MKLIAQSAGTSSPRDRGVGSKLTIDIFFRSILNHWSPIIHMICSEFDNSQKLMFALIFGPTCYQVCTHMCSLLEIIALIFGPTCDEVCTHIWTDLWPSLHSYLDRPVIEFALIFGPTCDQVCTHIWTDLWSSLHSYLDLLVMKFALIYGPTRDEVCTLIWTHLWKSLHS